MDVDNPDSSSDPRPKAPHKVRHERSLGFGGGYAEDFRRREHSAVQVQLHASGASSVPCAVAAVVSSLVYCDVSALPAVSVSGVSAAWHVHVSVDGFASAGNATVHMAAGGRGAARRQACVSEG